MLFYLCTPKTSEFKIDDNVFSGVVERFTVDESKVKIEIDAGNENLICNYYLKENETMDYSDIPLGVKIEVTGTLKEPLNNTVPNTFNYKKYLYHKRTFYTCTVSEFNIVEEPDIFYRIKNAIVQRIMSYDIKDYLYTLIIGDKTLLDDEVYSKYRENGVSHLFAISGMHIGLFSILLLTILKRLKIGESKRYLLVVSFIWFYAFLVGFTSSVMRACMLFTFEAVNKLLKLEISPFKIFLLVGCTLIIFNPGIVFDVGFIYSFTIAGGLIACRKYLSKHKILGTSLVATLYSIPITVSNFYSINLFGVLNNLLFVPLMTSVVYPLCLLTFLFRFLEPIAKISLSMMELLNDITYKIDFLSFVVPKMSIVIIIIYYFVLIRFFLKKPKKITMVLLILVFSTKLAPVLDSSYRVDFLDVGQGDSALIRSPHGKEVILVDTGGVTFNSSGYRLSDSTINYLHSLGITRIDWLILTHGDFDHMGEAVNLVNNFKIENVVLNCGTYNDLENELIEVLDKKKIKYYSCIKELNIHNNKLYFLNTKEYDNENDNSSVIYTELNNYEFLFMGDASSVTEKEILNYYNLPIIDVLKVGHHGSKTSSSEEFIKSINPKYSLISVGKNNRYGHPNNEVLDNLSESKIYRTDQDGSIMFKIKKDKLEIGTCKP